MPDSNGPRPVPLVPLAMPMPMIASLRCARAPGAPESRRSRSPPARDRLAGGKVAAVELDGVARARLERRHVGHAARAGRGCAGGSRRGRGRSSRRPVEQPLHRERALRIAGAAHRHGRHLVGLDDRHVEAVGRQHVRSGQRGRRVVGQVDALRRIGALVVDQRAADAEEPPVGVEARSPGPSTGRAPGSRRGSARAGPRPISPARPSERAQAAATTTSSG